MLSRIVIIGLAVIAAILGVVLAAVLVDSDDLAPGTLEARALNVDIRDGSIVGHRGIWRSRRGRL